MKFFYYMFSAFFVWFYPRQLTHLICFGSRRDQVYTKGKKRYCAIYAFWTLLFLLPCLLMGNAIGVNSIFDEAIYFYILQSDSKEYIKLRSPIESDGNADNTQEEYDVWKYGIKKQIDGSELEQTLYDIVKGEKFFYNYNQLNDTLSVRCTENYFYIYIDNQMAAEGRIKKKLLYQVVSYYWYKDVLEKRRFGHSGFEIPYGQKKYFISY